jgi:hypothetical protein
LGKFYNILLFDPGKSTQRNRPREIHFGREIKLSWPSVLWDCPVAAVFFCLGFWVESKSEEKSADEDPVRR